MRLRGQESLNSLHHVFLIAVRQQEACARAQTCMEFAPDYPEQAAGLPEDILRLTMPHVENHERVLQAALTKDKELTVEAFENAPLVKGRASHEEIRKLAEDMRL